MNNIKMIFFFTLFAFHLSFSQQDAQYTQYMYNTISVNPAYAGSKGFFNAVFLHRTQWYGIEGAPSTQTISFDTPLSNFNQLAMGFSIINDKIGPSSETYFNIDCAYSIFVSKTGVLRFGLKATGYLLSVDYNRLNLSDFSDNEFTNNIKNRFYPNVGFGLYYHTDDFYLGLSLPNLLETNHLSEDVLVGKKRIHYYIISGYVFNLDRYIKFKPAMMTKLVFGAPLQVDVSANFLFNEKFTVGLAYRLDASISVLTNVQVSDSINIGIAYDKETTQLGNVGYNAGTYEIMVRFETPRKNVRRLTPRFF